MNSTFDRISQSRILPTLIILGAWFCVCPTHAQSTLPVPPPELDYSLTYIPVQPGGADFIAALSVPLSATYAQADIDYVSGIYNGQIPTGLDKIQLPSLDRLKTITVTFESVNDPNDPRGIHFDPTVDIKPLSTDPFSSGIAVFRETGNVPDRFNYANGDPTSDLGLTLEPTTDQPLRWVKDSTNPRIWRLTLRVSDYGQLNRLPLAQDGNPDFYVVFRSSLDLHQEDQFIAYVEPNKIQVEHRYQVNRQTYSIMLPRYPVQFPGPDFLRNLPALDDEGNPLPVNPFAIQPAMNDVNNDRYGSIGYMGLYSITPIFFGDVVRIVNLVSPEAKIDRDSDALTIFGLNMLGASSEDYFVSNINVDFLGMDMNALYQNFDPLFGLSPRVVKFLQAKVAYKAAPPVRSDWLGDPTDPSTLEFFPYPDFDPEAPDVLYTGTRGGVNFRTAGSDWLKPLLADDVGGVIVFADNAGDKNNVFGQYDRGVDALVTLGQDQIFVNELNVPELYTSEDALTRSGIYQALGRMIPGTLGETGFSSSEKVTHILVDIQPMLNLLPPSIASQVSRPVPDDSPTTPYYNENYETQRDKWLVGKPILGLSQPDFSDVPPQLRQIYQGVTDVFIADAALFEEPETIPTTTTSERYFGTQLIGGFTFTLPVGRGNPSGVVGVPNTNDSAFGTQRPELYVGIQTSTQVRNLDVLYPFVRPGGVWIGSHLTTFNQSGDAPDPAAPAVHLFNSVASIGFGQRGQVNSYAITVRPKPHFDYVDLTVPTAGGGASNQSAILDSAELGSKPRAVLGINAVDYGRNSSLLESYSPYVDNDPNSPAIPVNLWATYFDESTVLDGLTVDIIPTSSEITANRFLGSYSGFDIVNNVFYGSSYDQRLGRDIALSQIMLYADDDTEAGNIFDDDGDGLIDEELRNLKDDDGDGLIDEDCGDGDGIDVNGNGVYDIFDDWIPYTYTPPFRRWSAGAATFNSGPILFSGAFERGGSTDGFTDTETDSVIYNGNDATTLSAYFNYHPIVVPGDNTTSPEVPSVVFSPEVGNMEPWIRRVNLWPSLFQSVIAGAGGAIAGDAGITLHIPPGNNPVDPSLVYNPGGPTISSSWDQLGVNDIDQISAMAFSPNGNFLVMALVTENTAKLFDSRDLRSLKLLRSFTHSGRITSVAFSPNGQNVLTGSLDNTAKLWNASTGAEVRTFSGHTSGITAVAFSPDGTRAITGSADGTAKLWTVADGTEVRTFSGQHTAAITAVAYALDGIRVFTGGADNTAFSWDTRNGNLYRTYSGHTGPITSLNVSPDGLYLLTASEDGTAKMWIIRSNNRLTRTFSGHEGRVGSAVFSPDGNLVLTAGADMQALIWGTKSGDILRTLIGHTDEVVAAIFAPDGEHILTASNDLTAIAWELNVTGGGGNPGVDLYRMIARCLPALTPIHILDDPTGIYTIPGGIDTTPIDALGPFLMPTMYLPFNFAHGTVQNPNASGDDPNPYYISLNAPIVGTIRPLIFGDLGDNGRVATSIDITNQDAVGLATIIPPINLTNNPAIDIERYRIPFPSGGIFTRLGISPMVVSAGAPAEEGTLLGEADLGVTASPLPDYSPIQNGMNQWGVSSGPLGPDEVGDAIADLITQDRENLTEAITTFCTEFIEGYVEYLNNRQTAQDDYDQSIADWAAEQDPENPSDPPEFPEGIDYEIIEPKEVTPTDSRFNFFGANGADIDSGLTDVNYLIDVPDEDLGVLKGPDFFVVLRASEDAKVNDKFLVRIDEGSQYRTVVNPTDPTGDPLLLRPRGLRYSNFINVVDRINLQYGTPGVVRKTITTGEITVRSSNVGPTLRITSPKAGKNPTNQKLDFIITWDAFDPDNVATITLYVDTDNKDFNGQLIAKDLLEGEATSYTINLPIDVAGYNPNNEYYIHATITDGVNPPVSTYSDGSIIATSSDQGSPTVSAQDVVDYYKLERSGVIRVLGQAPLLQSILGLAEIQQRAVDMEVTPTSSGAIIATASGFMYASGNVGNALSGFVVASRQLKMAGNPATDTVVDPAAPSIDEIVDIEVDFINGAVYLLDRDGEILALGTGNKNFQRKITGETAGKDLYRDMELTPSGKGLYLLRRDGSVEVVGDGGGVGGNGSLFTDTEATDMVLSLSGNSVAGVLITDTKGNLVGRPSTIAPANRLGLPVDQNVIRSIASVPKTSRTYLAMTGGGRIYPATTDKINMPVDTSIFGDLPGRADDNVVDLETVHFNLQSLPLLINGILASIHAEDMNGFLSYLSSDYSDQSGNTLAGVKKAMGKYFDYYDILSFQTPQDTSLLTLAQSGDRVRVEFTVGYAMFTPRVDFYTTTQSSGSETLGFEIIEIPETGPMPFSQNIRFREVADGRGWQVEVMDLGNGGNQSLQEFSPDAQTELITYWERLKTLPDNKILYSEWPKNRSGIEKEKTVRFNVRSFREFNNLLIAFRQFVLTTYTAPPMLEMDWYDGDFFYYDTNVQAAQRFGPNVRMDFVNRDGVFKLKNFIWPQALSIHSGGINSTAGEIPSIGQELTSLENPDGFSFLDRGPVVTVLSGEADFIMIDADNIATVTPRTGIINLGANIDIFSISAEQVLTGRTRSAFLSPSSLLTVGNVYAIMTRDLKGFGLMQYNSPIGTITDPTANPPTIDVIGMEFYWRYDDQTFKFPSNF